MAVCGSQYFEKTGALQESLRQIEKRRLQLERQLSGQRGSDQPHCQMSIAKLRRDLENVCEREKRAKQRNLDLLKAAQRMCSCVGLSSPDLSALQQEKEKCWGRIEQLMAKGKTGTEERAGSSWKVTSSDEHFASKAQFSQSSVNLLCWPLGDGSPEFPLEVAGPSSSGMVPGRINLATSPCVTTVGRPHVSGSHAMSHVTSRSPQEEEVTDSSGTGQVENGSPEENFHHSKIFSDARRAKENVTGVPQGTSPQNGAENDANSGGDAENCQSYGVSSLTPKQTTKTSSELCLSVREGEDHIVLPEGANITDTHFGGMGPVGTLAKEGWVTPDVTQFGGDARQAVSEVRVERGQSLVASQVTPIGLSLEGFFHLMNSIEGRLDQRENELYKISSISEEKLNNLISLCEEKAALNEEDLEACGAVVLHQLQRLSWSTSKGCLLPEEIVSANWTTADERKLRSRLPTDAMALWARWLQHARVLQGAGILTTSQIVQQFTPLLVQKDALHLEKAKVLVKKVLLQASDASPSESNRSSCDLPSLLDDGVQSGEEGGEEESFVESIPIKETKEYQLLKQSVSQQRWLSSEEEDDASDPDLSVDGQTNNTWGPAVPSKTSPLRSEQSRHFWTEGAVSAVRSKAFWGESDDGSSDVEAALRPPSRHTDDDFDFYD